MAQQPIQHGNVMFLILIAVILFAALGYAITSSSRSGGSDISKDTIGLTVSEIENYAATINGAITRLKLSGCSETDLSFYHPSFDNANDYAGETTWDTAGQNKCHVFRPEGGGVAWSRPPKLVVDYGVVNYLFAGKIGIEDVGTNGCSQTELAMFLMVPKTLCLAYNDRQSIPNPGGNPPQDSDSQIYDPATKFPMNWAKFGWGGQFYGCGFEIGAGHHNPRAPEIIGKPSGCFETTTAGGGYFIYDVITPR
jgi:hypothetical protein